LGIEQYSVGHRIEGSHEISNVLEMVREIEEITYMARQAVKRKAVIMLHYVCYSELFNSHCQRGIRSTSCQQARMKIRKL